MLYVYIYVYGCARLTEFRPTGGCQDSRRGSGGSWPKPTWKLVLIFVACPGWALAVAMMVGMAVALVRPGNSNAQKTILARHLPSHCETLASLGLRLVKVWDMCIHGFPQTSVASKRNDYSSARGISVGSWSSNAVVSCARTPTFRKI